MRVLLVYPPIDAPVPAQSTLLGLGYLASVLRQGGHEVQIFDYFNKPTVDMLTWEFDILGVSAMFTEYKQSIQNFLMKAKCHFPKLHIVVGGAHASTFPEEMIEFADCVVLFVVVGFFGVHSNLQRLEVVPSGKRRMISLQRTGRGIRFPAHSFFASRP